MANGLLDLWAIRFEALRSEMQFGLALALWLCVNEKPPLVPLERQTLSCVGFQRQPPLWPRRRRPIYPTCQVPSHCGQITERCQHITLRRAIRNPRWIHTVFGQLESQPSQPSFDLFRREPCRENNGSELVPYRLGLRGKNRSKSAVVRYFFYGQIHGRMSFEIW